MREKTNYHFYGEEEIDSPSLIYYEDIIEENINKAISLAGGAERLWPHIKTHKTSALIRMQIARGIKRFKCATIAEAELCAMSGADDVMVAYPLVGPAIDRFARLRSRYTKTVFWAIGDNLGQLELLGKASISHNQTPVDFLIDVNLGMYRTGVLPARLDAFYLEAVKIKGLRIKGFHCYDGHLGIADLKGRREAVTSALEKFREVKKSLEAKGYEIPVLVMGGSPTFACHRETAGVYLSPGTFFVQDYASSEKYPDLPFKAGAAILSRVISHPGEDLFTIDTGTKAIAADPVDRGVIADLPLAKPVLQSEEHWVWQLQGNNLPPIGTVLYILPAHICPTSALYPGIQVVSNGKLVNYWEVGARNRKITI
ncbi:MAG: D-TA family PLP-dependent enzyme [Treponema sp.]|nr:D-TA family PLP-dependent enzyme [Treponema sp.]